jgi:hypothetical protein
MRLTLFSLSAFFRSPPPKPFVPVSASWPAIDESLPPAQAEPPPVPAVRQPPALELPPIDPFPRSLWVGFSDGEELEIKSRFTIGTLDEKSFHYAYAQFEKRRAESFGLSPGSKPPPLNSKAQQARERNWRRFFCD